MLPLAVDVEELLCNWLLDQTPLAALVGDRIYTQRPATPTYPLILVRRGPGRRAVRNHLDAPRIQIDAYAKTKADAWQVAATIQATLPSIVGDHPEGIVTGVDEQIGLTWLPEPPDHLPRYMQDVVIYTHPTPD